MFDMKGFLENDNINLRINSSSKEGQSSVFLKVQSEQNRIFYLFKQENEKYFNPFKEKKFVGVYDSEENIFFEVSKGLVKKNLNEIDFRDVKIEQLETVYRKIINDIKEEIVKTINKDENYFIDNLLVNTVVDNVSLMIKQNAREKAFELYIKDIEPFENEFIDLKEIDILYKDNISILLAYLKDKDKVIRIEANKIIYKNAESFYEQLLSYKERQKELNRLRVANLYIDEKNLLKCICERQMKTLNIIVRSEQGNIELKIDNNLSYNRPYILTSDIRESEDKKEYLRTNKGDRIDLKNILYIKYHGQVIYNK
ncbi:MULTISPECIES: hypothetical protein [unclassified Clostridioides]|uniref:hypothetical protein n=1 Tax=unclassified Clostridioides TaxID=2635829 RepID=UPI001D110421|nr:hypothetical protein [Clostridioides sp. ES-S-0145-01]MCC0681956.1 hypothetical protein [Clostridioides sp. ES-S-0005-03]MCC0709305.1 hypothetical protein [Clostridioides sp. ES-S-0190-01]UDN64148.1 hypothetical protein IC758_19960 [Clostridioides sp. ES-W-0016-02]